MIITYWKGVFVCDTLDEKGVLKKAGFQLHEPTVCNLETKKCKACHAKIGRRFWTSQIEAATRLKAYCNPRALEVMREHLEILKKSRASNANIEIPSPEGLSYLGYQKAGIAYALQRKDTLIGDEMGLGKSIQALGFINYLKPKRVVVVCPNTLMFNWENEALKWLVDDYEIWTVKSKKEEVPSRDMIVVIVNYEKLGGESPLKKSLNNFDVGVYDECHLLKNPSALRSIAILGADGLMARSKRNLFLSGTPVENYPKEIWPLAASIAPVKFGNWWEFAARYCGLHQEQRRGVKTWVADGHSHLAELQQKMRTSFMVRRLKKDVMSELPPKRRQLILLQDNKIDWSQHPQVQEWKNKYEASYNAAMAKLECARTEDEFKKCAAELDAVTGIAFEKMSEFRHQSALAKLGPCLEFVENLMNSGLEKLVIFAHHRDVLEKTYDKFKSDAVLVYGDSKNRGDSVEQFQNGTKKIFIGQIRTAGVGITLTSASTVAFFESDWSPGVVTQAEDRLCRIGQRKMVHVLQLALKNTLDANMIQKVIKKQEVIEKMLDLAVDLKSKKS